MKQFIEDHPVLFTLLGVTIAALITGLFTYLGSDLAAARFTSQQNQDETILDPETPLAHYDDPRGVISFDYPASLATNFGVVRQVSEDKEEIYYAVGPIANYLAKSFTEDPFDAILREIEERFDKEALEIFVYQVEGEVSPTAWQRFVDRRISAINETNWGVGSRTEVVSARQVDQDQYLIEARISRASARIGLSQDLHLMILLRKGTGFGITAISYHFGNPSEPIYLELEESLLGITVDPEALNNVLSE